MSSNTAKQKTYYLAGPMRGIDKFNFPAFDEAAKRGRDLGHVIISPADMDREIGFDGDKMNGSDAELAAFDLNAAIRRDVEAILTADGIALLPGWEKSTGTKAEYRVAVWAMKDILSAVNYKPLNGVIELPPEHVIEPNMEVIKPAINDLVGKALSAGAAIQASITTVVAPETPEFKPGEIKSEGGFVIKDTGNRQVFETGAQRDMGGMKGFFHCIPYSALERLAIHFQAGAAKYVKHNWRKGLPLSCFLDSAYRHLAKLAERHTDEDHAAAVLWNIACYIETERAVLAGEKPESLYDVLFPGEKMPESKKNL